MKNNFFSLLLKDATDKSRGSGGLVHRFDTGYKGAGERINQSREGTFEDPS